MKRLLLAAVAALGITSSAQSAELPVYKAAPVFNWSGFYFGGHFGYGFSNVDWAFTASAVRSDHWAEGVFGGLQAGYNFQVGKIVWGIEADAATASISGTAACPNPAFRCGSDVRSLFSVRGRIGSLAWNPNTLIYATAGYGAAEIKYTALPIVGGFINTEWRTGPVVGTGIEWTSGASQWRYKVEYLAYFFGNETVTNVIGPVASETLLHTVKLGVNYRY